MKPLHTVLLLLFVLVAVILPGLVLAQPVGYAITQRGADWRVLSQTTVEHGTNRVHQYTELATGLNYTNGYGQWVESKELITILSTGGAAATQGRHKVYFPADIYNGVLEVITPDGRHLKSRPLGVSYDDGSNSVFIAELKHAQGYLTSSNTVTYRDAFAGIKADLVATYRRGGFECDLVFRQQPPTPGDYGLDETFTTLQLVTEFFNTADPQEIPAAYDDNFGLQDSTLKFGNLTMTHGKAFATTNSQPSTINSQLTSAPVYKSWVHLASRTFLIEEVPLLNITDDLNALPLTAMGGSQKSEARTLMASNHRQFPPAHEFVADTNQILIAVADLNRQPGVVLDYQTLNSSQANYTFQADTTYYLSGTVYLSGTNVLEGGTVIKYARSAGELCINYDTASRLNCLTSPDRPAVLTAMDDNSVGETISDSTGNPTITMATTMEDYFLTGRLRPTCMTCAGLI